MANNNYRMAVKVGRSGTISNPDGLQLNYTDDILSEVVFYANFPSIPGACSEEFTLRESEGGVTVDRSALTIDVPLPTSVFGDLDLAGGSSRLGEFSVYSEDGAGNATSILDGTIVARR